MQNNQSVGIRAVNTIFSNYSVVSLNAEWCGEVKVIFSLTISIIPLYLINENYNWY